MQKLNFFQARKALQDSEAVCIVSNSNTTYFYFTNDTIRVISKQYRYSLSFKEFEELYSKETFYLYDDKEEGIDEEKDSDYYQWKSRGVN